MIIISHTLETGTVVYGTDRNDGASHIIKRSGFRPSNSLADHPEYGSAFWYVASTRRRRAKRDYIDRCAAALRDAGHQVRIEVDNTTLPTTSFAELEQERYVRAEERASRFTAFAGNATAQGSKAIDQVVQERRQIPLGQPHLIGHHSFPTTVRQEQRRNAKEERGLEQVRRGEQWRRRSDAAERFRSGREDLGTTQRRIERLEAEVRAHQRVLAGGRELWEITVTAESSSDFGISLVERLSRRPEGSQVLSLDEDRNVAEVLIAVGPRYREEIEAQIALLTEEIRYWQDHVAALQADQGVRVWSRADFARGDFIRCGGKRWYQVVRVNPKTLSVANGANARDLEIVTQANARSATGGPGWTDKLPYREVTDRMAAAEARSRFPAAFTAAESGRTDPSFAERRGGDAGGSPRP